MKNKFFSRKFVPAVQIRRLQKGMVIDMKELRELIRDLRDDHDLKQKAVAAHLGLSQQTYSNYENGRREIPIWVIVELAKFYQVSTDYLLGTDNAYLGNTNLRNYYLKDITMHDIMYDIQTLNGNSRKELLRYIQYLKYLQRKKPEKETKES